MLIIKSIILLFSCDYIYLQYSLVTMLASRKRGKLCNNIVSPRP